MTYVFCPQTQYVKPSRQIPTYDAEDVSNLLNSADQELTLEHHVEFRKQSGPEEAEKSESEPKEAMMTASELAEGLRLIEPDAKLLEDIRPVTSNNWRLIIWIRPCFVGILQEKERSSFL